MFHLGTRNFDFSSLYFPKTGPAPKRLHFQSRGAVQNIGVKNVGLFYVCFIFFCKTCFYVFFILCMFFFILLIFLIYWLSSKNHRMLFYIFSIIFFISCNVYLWWIKLIKVILPAPDNSVCFILVHGYCGNTGNLRYKCKKNCCFITMCKAHSKL